MKPNQMLTSAVQLEKDIAAFYERLSNAVGFEKYQDIFLKLSEHSHLHADMIDGLVEDFNIPDLDISPMQELQETVKQRIIQHLNNESDVAVGCQKLANAEDILGKIYLTISANYEKVARSYQKASDQFKKLAQDEQQHRDQLLAEID